MDEEMMEGLDEGILEGDVLTLFDEDDQEIEMEVIAVCEYEDTKYYALIPYAEEPNDDDIEYMILKETNEHLVTLDSEEEFNAVASIFDGMLTDEE